MDDDEFKRKLEHILKMIEELDREVMEYYMGLEMKKDVEEAVAGPV